MYIAVNSGSTEHVPDQLSQISALQDRLDSSQSVSATPTHHNYHTFNMKVNLLVFFSLFYNENFLSPRPILSRLNCSGYNIIRHGTIFKNLVLSQSQTAVRNVHVSSKNKNKKKSYNFPEPVNCLVVVMGI